MATDSLANMTDKELRHERNLARIQLGDVVTKLKKLEESAKEYRDHIRNIEARMAFLERMGRKYPEPPARN